MMEATRMHSHPHSMAPSPSARTIQALDSLRISPALRRTHRKSQPTPPRPLRPTTLPRICASAAAAPLPDADAEEWDFLDAPGLTPPRSEIPKTDAFSRLARTLHAALAAVIPALASPELLRRLAFSLSMLALVRIGHYIPTPGLHLPSILALAHGATNTAIGDDSLSLTSLTSTLTGSVELPGNVYLLSITPYMTASFLLATLQLIPEFRKMFSQMRDQGRQGREAINGFVNLAFIVCAVGQAAVEAGRLSALAAGGAAAAAGLVWKAQVGVSLMAGAVICKYAVQQVDQYGLGDGTGVVIGAGIALAYWQSLKIAFTTLATAPPGILSAISAAALMFGLVAAVVWVQGIELRLPLTFFLPRRSTARGQHPVLRLLSRGVDSGAALDAQQLLPLRLSPAGTRQLLFANFWASTLAAPLAWARIDPGFLTNPWAFAALVFMLEAVSIADATPRQAADFLAQSDAGVRGLSPGVDTERFLALRRRQMKFLNAAFIAGVSLAARAVDTAVTALIGVPLGCLNLLLLVSTVLGAARQVDALTQGPRVEAAIAQEYAALAEVGGREKERGR